jgi:hypothetical protein
MNYIAKTRKKCTTSEEGKSVIPNKGISIILVSSVHAWIIKSHLHLQN